MAIARIRQSMVKGLTDDIINSNREETFINSKNFSIKDEVFEINNNQTGSGISSGKAGIKINRGDLEPSLLIFDENDDSFKMGTEKDMKLIASQEWVSEKLDTVVDNMSKDMTQEEINSFIEDIFQ